MSIYSGRRRLLRKMLDEQEDIQLPEVLPDEEESIFDNPTNKKVKKPAKSKDEWSDIYEMSKSIEFEVKPHKEDDDDSLIILEDTPEANSKRKSDVLYKELFGELGSTEKNTLSKNARKRRRKAQQKINQEAEKTLDGFRKLDEFELNYVSQKLYQEVAKQEENASEIKCISAEVNKVQEFNLKFKYLAKIYRLPIKSNEKIFDKLSDLAKLLNVSEPQKLRFYIDQTPISLDETPETIGLNVGSIVECILFNKEVETSTLVDPNSITIKIRDSNAHKKNQITSLKFDKFAPLGQLFEKYAKEKGLDLKKLTFDFDGDTIQDDHTAEDLDMEDDSLIDVLGTNQ